jgi:hypothetical protein
MKSKFVTGLAFAGLLWSVVPANAVAAVESDLVSVNGNITTIFENAAESTNPPSPFVLTTLGPNFVTGFGVVLTEPGLPPGTRAPSDVLVGNNDHFLVFVSDDENGNFPPGTPTVTNPVFLVETGNFQDVSDVFDLPVGTVKIASEVPLPAALPLFATGLVGLLLLGWRRKKAAA